MNAKTDVKSAKGKRKFIKLTPLWSDSWEKGSFVIVPTRENRIENNTHTVRRVFLFKKDDGRITSSQIVEFVGEKYDVSSNLDHLIKNLDHSQITGFNGSIYYYDINYYPTHSAVYKDGLKIEAQASWVIQQYKSEPIPVVSTPGKLIAAKRSGDKMTVAVYWVGIPQPVQPECYYVFTQINYYNNGVLYQIINTYQYHFCPDYEGSGSGSGSSSGSGSGTQTMPVNTVEDYGGNEEQAGVDCAGVPNGTAVQSPCGCIGGTTGVPECSKTPCKEVKLINKRMSDPVRIARDVKTLDTTLSIANPYYHEFGYDLNQGMTNDAELLYPDSVVTRKGPAPHQFNFGFAWSPISGYSMGSVHAHTTAIPPSPDDAVALGKRLNDVALNNDAVGKARYVAQAQLVTITTGATYVITIKDAAKMQTAASNFNSATAKTEYDTKADDFRRKNPSAPQEDAQIYALLKMYGDAISIYKGPKITQTTAPARIFKPIEWDTEPANSGGAGVRYIIKEKNCN